MYMSVIEAKTSFQNFPRSPKKSLKEDPNHGLDTHWVVSIDEAIDALCVGRRPADREA